MTITEVAFRLGVSLERKGSEYVGLCPLHDEDTPSFYINEEKGVFYCFGCGEGGGPATLVSKALGVEYREAKCLISEWEGKPCKEGEVSVPKQAKERLLAYLSGALSNNALDYLRRRGLNDETISRFNLGFFTNLDDVLNGAKLSIEQAESLGLNYHFQNRISIPLFNVAGVLVGFSGRAIEDTQSPKYYTSPELDKSKLLYGLNLARKEIKTSGEAFVVEGQFDVMALHQDGVVNAVAAMGTAFGLKHALALKRAGAQRIYYLADGDLAGLNALIKASRVSKAVGLKFFPYQFPEGKDASDFIGELGQIYKKIKPEWAFWFEKAREQFSDPADIALYVSDIMPVYGKLDPNFREFAVAMKRHFNVNINELYGVFARGKARKKVEFYKNLGPDLGHSLRALIMQSGSRAALEYARQLFEGMELDVDESSLSDTPMSKEVERDIDMLYVSWLNERIDNALASQDAGADIWMLRATVDLYLEKWEQ